MRKKALITGITGQDGSYLAELLIEKGYEVHGLIRRTSIPTTQRIKHLIEKNQITLHYGDLTESGAIISLVGELQPDEIYNLGAQSDVGVSFKTPEYTSNVDGLGVLRILEAVRVLNLTNKTKIYQASTSELFGKVEECPQDENTPFHPYSPYGVAKQYAFWMCKEYREAYNMFVCNGILFNHESPRRGEEFVTRKITLAVAKIKYGLMDHIELGNLNSKRDWGYSKDYVECMWQMLQQDHADDFVLATGVQHTVREFCTLAFLYGGIELLWKGENEDEKAYDKKTGKMLVCVSKKFYRPTEVSNLLGNPTKAKENLGFNPNKTSFESLCKLMVESDIKKIEEELKTK